MAERRQQEWVNSISRVAAAGLGVAVAGPLGGALGGLMGEAVGGHAAKLIATYAEKFGDKAGEKLLEIGGDSLIERLKGEGPGLEAVYREALRVSLATVRADVGDEFADWFVHWEVSLAGKPPLRLEALRAEQLVPEGLNEILRSTLVRLDGLGAMLPGALTFHERVMPEGLLGALEEKLPGLLEKSFGALIVSETYAVAWKEVERAFQAETGRLLREVKEDTSALLVGQALTHVKQDVALEMQQAMKAEIESIRQLMLSQAEQNQSISPQEVRALRADAAQAKEYEKLFRAAKEANPSLEELLASGDLDAAARRKEEQIARQKSDQAQSYFELGMIEELRFDWEKALEAYREAWRLEKRTEYGFRFAYCAQKQNQFNEAIDVYEVLRSMYIDAEEVASTLNNLAVLYRKAQRMREAEGAYVEALSIRKGLAEVNEAYLPEVAMTLNNLANFYSGTQRMREAEAAYIRALSIREGLAELNESYLPDVAMTQNNLAELYRVTRRMVEAEELYGKALSTRRQFAAKNPEVYMPYVATTLNNLGNLYSATRRRVEAEEAYVEALAKYDSLATVNAAAYLPYVATTLNNLGNLYLEVEEVEEGERCCAEAEAILAPLWEANPEVHGNQMAKILLLRALLGEAIGRPAAELCALARWALEMSYEAAVRDVTQELMERFCRGS